MYKRKTMYKMVLFLSLYAYENQLMITLSLKLQSAPSINESDVLESFQRRNKWFQRGSVVCSLT